MTKERAAKLTNVLIFKDGYYYITIKMPYQQEDDFPSYYQIAPEEWNLHNGFEFASDAYAYLVHLQTKKEKVEK